jgi:hypothetical protein
MELCAPALIYLAFSITQIIMDLFYGLFNTAVMKVFIMIIITILLNVLCNKGMGIVSWIIVFIPFILMTTITAILLYAFGLNPTTGTLNVQCNNENQNKSGNLIYKTTIVPPNTDVTYLDAPLDDLF